MARPPSFAALAASLLLAGCATLAAPPAAERGIVVIGTGRVAARPDTAVVSLGAEARAPRLADATAEVDRAMRAVLARVREAGVADADIRTLVYAIEPIAEPRPPGEPSVRVAGYRVSNVVQVRIRDARAVARLVDAAVAAGANVVRDVHFTLDDPSRPEAEARALAMRDAAARARQLAAAAGVSLGRLLSVTESSPVRPLARMSLASAPGPVEPGQLEVTVSVEARYADRGRAAQSRGLRAVQSAGMDEPPGCAADWARTFQEGCHRESSRPGRSRVRERRRAPLLSRRAGIFSAASSAREVLTFVPPLQPVRHIACSGTWPTDGLPAEKGNPVARRGRKAAGQNTLTDSRAAAGRSLCATAPWESLRCSRCC